MSQANSVATEKAPIDGLFDSKSVVVVGVSSKRGNLAARIVRNMITLEYKGRLFQVGRSDDTLNDMPVYRSVLDIPEPVDFASIAVPAALVPGVLEECGKKGVRYASITSSGFGEFSTDRQGLEQQMLATARQYGMRFLGPNCQGIRDFESGLSTRFGKQEKQPARNCAAGLIVQSGTVSSTFERFLNLENIGLTRLASIGNKLDVDEADLLPAYLNHEPTKMIFMYLEGIRQGRKLFEIAREATKPIVLLKGNISPTTATIARSHSASVLNEQRIADAAAKQAGIIQITQFAESQLAAKAFLLPPMNGNNLVIFGGSGGMAVVGADWAYRAKFDLVPLPEKTAQSIESRLAGGYIKIGNPVDLGDFFDMSTTLEMIDETLAVPSVDGMVVITFDPTPGKEFHNYPPQPFAAVAKSIMLKHNKPIALVYAATRDVIQNASAEADMPIFAGADEAIRGLQASRDYWSRRAARSKPAGKLSLQSDAIASILLKTAAGSRSALDYGDGFAMLAAAGIKVAAPKIVASSKDAADAAREAGGPVCMKLLAGDGSHKTELGGVRLGLNGDAAVRQAFEDFSRAHPGTPISLQAMVSGTELMLGARRDPHFGPVVSIGLGGTLVELLDDAALRLAPITRVEAEEMLGESRAGRLIAGWRGAAEGDREAVLDALQRLSQLMADHPEISEIDVNPLMVLPKGKGVCAVDARIFVGAA